jgi:hypothetical protein
MVNIVIITIRLWEDYIKVSEYLQSVEQLSPQGSGAEGDKGMSPLAVSPEFGWSARI